MAVPKKRTSRSKKRIRKNIWKGKAYWSTLIALTVGYSFFSRKSKILLPDKYIKNIKNIKEN
uniref:Large ribosomal subunit protein bL32c n=1 Tax=Cyphia belfastica TaxID=2041114 RepID=A0A291F366_9ASTR|nr:ribosomal protein L32 [Cyphia belfastica]ATG26552.1 ribosomal protein L32 [Cyphia belfastica]